MIEELEEFYESEGFEDFYERCLAGKLEEEIWQYSAEIFKEDDHKLEMRERRYH